MIGEDLTFGAQRVDRVDQADQIFRVVQVGYAVNIQATRLVQRFAEDATGQTVLTAPQVDQHQRGVVDLGAELRCEGVAHIGQRGKRGDDQAHRRGDFVPSVPIGPLRAHRQAVFAHGDRDAQRGAQFHAHGFDSFIQRGVFAGLAAGGHPVGAELHARELNRRSQQVGDGFSHRHATRGRRMQRGQRRALAHAHRLAGKAGEIGQCDCTVGHRHLPGSDHLVAVAQTTDGTVANRDEEALGRHSGVAQHVDHGFLQIDLVQVHGDGFARHGFDIAVHLGRFAEQHVHRHVDGRFLAIVEHRQMPLFRRNPHHRKRAALALTKRLELRQRFGGDRQHIALLAFVAPDFFGRQAVLFQRHCAQIESCTASGVVDQLRESV